MAFPIDEDFSILKVRPEKNAAKPDLSKHGLKKIKVGKKFETKEEPGPQAQVAMVVLDPHTGAILALVGGRTLAAGAGRAARRAATAQGTPDHRVRRGRSHRLAS